MKFLDLRKYLFSYTYIIGGLFALIFFFTSNDIIKFHAFLGFLDNEDFYMVAVFAILVSLLCYIEVFIEIIIRIILKFIPKKYLPDIKFSIKVTMPKSTNLILSTIFYILIAIATIPLVVLINLFK